MPLGRFSAPESKDVAGVVQWIVANVPCFEGTIPKEWQDAVHREAARNNIPRDVLIDAMVAAEASGYRFLVVSFKVPKIRDRTHEVHDISEHRQKMAAQHTARWLEEEFKKAKRSDDVKKMQALIDQFELLLRVSRRHADRRHEEILRHAPSLRAVQMGPGDPRARVRVRLPPRAARR